MKVNTDGILLGAWSNVDNAKSILDIGSGTALIALMLAQKVAELSQSSKVTGVEIDEAAAIQAQSNVMRSPWSKNVKIVQQDIQSYSQEQQLTFDLLVSNPPYFTNSLKAQSKARDAARHNDGLSFDDLLRSASSLATKAASFNLILPCEEAERLLELANQYNWYINKICLVSTVTGKKPTRSVLKFTKQGVEQPERTELTIRDKSNAYTEAFTKLCKDYYLFM
jgi:tRNA1Val (adenine37-N6)-methyltransferase